MTIKWVKVDPLVMNGEPFCFGTRLTVRNVLEMRRNGLTPDEIKEILLQSAIYCGVPAANTAFKIAQGVLDERSG